MKHSHFSAPRLSLRFVPIWRRHFLVWKKVAATSILGHLADPVIYMLGLGYGLGSLLPNMGGIDISPIVLLLACYFVQSVILPNLARAIA